MVWFSIGCRSAITISSAYYRYSPPVILVGSLDLLFVAVILYYVKLDFVLYASFLTIRNNMTQKTTIRNYSIGPNANLDYQETVGLARAVRNKNICPNTDLSEMGHYRFSSHKH